LSPFRQKWRTHSEFYGFLSLSARGRSHRSSGSGTETPWSAGSRETALLRVDLRHNPKRKLRKGRGGLRGDGRVTADRKRRGRAALLGLLHPSHPPTTSPCTEISRNTCGRLTSRSGSCRTSFCACGWKSGCTPVSRYTSMFFRSSYEAVRRCSPQREY
jgi:hypothetical protein